MKAHRELLMRTNIEIDDELIKEAMRLGGYRTKRAAVEAGLRLLADAGKEGGISPRRGKMRSRKGADESRRGQGQRI